MAVAPYPEGVWGGRVPRHLERTLSILESAYPRGMPDEDYLPVMRVLAEGMSIRNLGDVMFAFTTFTEAHHDAYGIGGDQESTDPDVRRVRELLVGCGWDPDSDE
ncbi:DUF3349 domain-containing protein [Embleya sp. NPDC005971]|uniref:DUF3349 domain-containing protein n=1 Tax=unclassified Embleya TaxID=2699296 RepID=UPI0033C364FB